MKHLFIYQAFLMTVVIFIASCKKEFDIPPVQPAATLNKINIANIKAKYSANINYRFKTDSSLYCVVTADEVSGNLFKEIYVKDVTGALHVRLINSGGLFTGDSIRINLKDVILNENNKLIQLDSVDAEASIVKLASGYNPQPVSLSIAQINANTAATNSVQSKLVKIDNVEFVTADRNQTFADAVGKAALTRIIRSCTDQTLTVRTSGYCSFAGKNTPGYNGSITGIVSQYGTTMQLVLRNYNEVNMTNALCSTSTPTNGVTYLTKNFNDNSLGSGGWNSYTVTNNSVNWAIASFSTTVTPFAKISGFYGGVNTLAETWYVSPPLNLSNSTNPVLSFQTAAKFSGTALEVLASTTYTGGALSSAVWVSLPNITLSATTGNYVWTPSGAISLGLYKSVNTRIAFKYKSTSTAATTYELDDIVVKEN